MKTALAAVIAASLIGGAAIAADPDARRSIEAGLDRMMDACRGMMGAGMMGGGRRSPNAQWRERP